MAFAACRSPLLLRVLRVVVVVVSVVGVAAAVLSVVGMRGSRYCMDAVSAFLFPLLMAYVTWYGASRLGVRDVSVGVSRHG